MISVVVVLVVLGVLVTIILAWRSHLKDKKNKDDQIERLSNAQAYKMRILRHLLSSRNKTDYKMSIMETLNIEIEMMKICEDQLKKEKLVTTQPHTMTLTDFGTQFGKIYAEQEENQSP